MIPLLFNDECVGATVNFSLIIRIHSAWKTGQNMFFKFEKLIFEKLTKNHSSV